MDRRDPEWLEEVARFISRGAPAQCAEFLDNRPDVAEQLKKFGFNGPLRHNAFGFVARLINSTKYAEWAALLFPLRAPHFTPVAIQMLPAHERVFLVKFCLGAAQQTPGAHAVSHLVSYTKDVLWYVTRGAVPDGKRTWKLWRLVTQHRHLLSIAKKDHWHIIRALLATCPLPQLPPSANALCSRADEFAVKVILDPPAASLTTVAVTLARKIDPDKVSVANIPPTGAHAHLVFDIIDPAGQEPQQATFKFTGRATDLNIKFVLKTIHLDNANGTLLSAPHDLFWNQASFRLYSNRVALFSEVIQRAPGVFRVTAGCDGDAYGFCMSALVGLFALHRNALEAIKTFFELSKRVRIGNRPNLLWPMLWSTHFSSARKKCFALLIGPRTRSGGVFNPHMPLFNNRELYRMFTWYHDTVAAFALNPAQKIVGHLANTGDVYTDDIKRQLQIMHRFLVALHTQHPDIGPNGGAYTRSNIFPAAIGRAIKSAQSCCVKAYLKQWFLPSFHRLSTAHLRHRLNKQAKLKLRMFVTCLGKKGPNVPAELLSIIFSFYL